MKRTESAEMICNERIYSRTSSNSPATWVRSTAITLYVCLYVTTRTRTLGSYGDRTFAAAGSRLSNSVPVQLRNPDITYGLFRRQLKGRLFREARTRRSVTSDIRRHRKTRDIYLLTRAYRRNRLLRLVSCCRYDIVKYSVGQTGGVLGRMYR